MVSEEPTARALPSSDLVDDLVQLTFVVMAALTRVGAAHDLSLTVLRLLGVLRGRQPKMAELATHFGLEKSTVSGLVDRVESRGLVERSADPDDGRAVRVALTKRGRALAREVETDLSAALSPLTANLGRVDQRQLHRLAARMLEGRS